MILRHRAEQLRRDLGLPEESVTKILETLKLVLNDGRKDAKQEMLFLLGRAHEMPQ